ncbi:MAG TPA: hypothetical protein VM074_02990 [Solimonas sp.]|nr:hypothetical protein [Solimonas sp.]
MDGSLTVVEQQPDEQARARRNVRLALIHVALALACLAAFVIAQLHRAAG